MDTPAEDRTAELREKIARLTTRVGHLVAQARRVETGVEEWKVKRRGGEETDREEFFRLNFSEAVAYWREAREAEDELEKARAELRTLEASGAGQPISVEIHFDGPRDDA